MSSRAPSCHPERSEGSALFACCTREASLAKKWDRCALFSAVSAPCQRHQRSLRRCAAGTFPRNEIHLRLRPMLARIALLVILVPAPMLAQARPSASVAFDSARYERSAPELRGLRWRLVGPFRGGRSVAVAGDPSNPRVFYFGAV